MQLDPATCCACAARSVLKRPADRPQTRVHRVFIMVSGVLHQQRAMSPEQCTTLPACHSCCSVPRCTAVLASFHASCAPVLYLPPASTCPVRAVRYLSVSRPFKDRPCGTRTTHHRVESHLLQFGFGSSTAYARVPTHGDDKPFTQPGGLLQGGRSVRVR